MKYKLLGRTGVQVSQLCFGTMSFGGDADEATSASMYKAVRDAGINFFDTADVYAQGRSEEILGRLIAPCRDRVVIASKAYFPSGEYGTIATPSACAIGKSSTSAWRLTRLYIGCTATNGAQPSARASPSACAICHAA